jgi:hypothetical protein
MRGFSEEAPALAASGQHWLMVAESIAESLSVGQVAALREGYEAFLKVRARYGAFLKARRARRGPAVCGRSPMVGRAPGP